MAVIFVAAFYGNFSLTGKSVDSFDLNNSLVISSKLTIPELELKGDYSQISILADSGSFVYIGDQKMMLNERTVNEIILKDFSGKIKFNEYEISLIDGKAAKIILNDIPMSNKRGRATNVHTDSGLDYRLIEFGNDTYIKEIDHVLSGEISLGNKADDKIGLDEKELIISSFFGKVRIEDKRMFLDGSVEKIEIKDEKSKIIISY
jgi:hypothetical protein